MDIDKLKIALQEERAKLEQELTRLGTKDEKTGDWIPLGEVSEEEADKNDLGDRDEEFGERANILGELETRLYDVESALKKIEANDGSYGKCEVSGNQIEEDRLSANPAARTCKEHM